MKSLLSTLDIETFILDLREAISVAPEIEGVNFVLRDGVTLEASLPKKKSLNFLFFELERQDIHVRSMRNKANRLEELFLGLVDRNNGSKKPGDSKAAAGVSP
jgi:ABC-2 type transport system ATP-binding protein